MAKDDYGFMLLQVLVLWCNSAVLSSQTTIRGWKELTCSEGARTLGGKQAVDELRLMGREDKSDGQREARSCTAHIWE